VFLVELATIHDPDNVVPAIAATLGIADLQSGSGTDAPSARLAEILYERELLLVLDNCEHLIDESAGVADELLAFCPRLHLLATSRERLGLPGECVWAAPPCHSSTISGKPFPRAEQARFTRGAYALYVKVKLPMAPPP
jgi:predicted ATPase